MELERGLLRFKLFLSTPSARRATSASAGRKCPGSDFYPRPPRGGRHFLWRPRCKAVPISIHALREEGDVIRALVKKGAMAFLSTPSARRATTCPSFRLGLSRYFYPRPPRGGRRRNMLQAMVNEAFLSTPSARRATRVHRRHRQHHRDFYPRPPRGGRRRKPTRLSG